MSERRWRRRSWCSSRGCGRCWPTTPEMPATVLAERVGWTGSITWFRENVQADPAGVPAAWIRLTGCRGMAGDAAQCDLWFPPRQIPLEDGTARLLPVLVMTRRTPGSRRGGCCRRARPRICCSGCGCCSQQLGRGATTADLGQRGRHRPRANAGLKGCRRSRGRWPPGWCSCQPRDPESKGIVERRNGWFETSFMPGAQFASPADFNAQFADWLAGANTRVVRTIKARRRLLERTWPRWWRCRRSPPAAGLTHTGSGCGGTTTCGCWATTTRSTRCDRPDRRRPRRPGPGRTCLRRGRLVADHARVWGTRADDHRPGPRGPPQPCGRRSKPAPPPPPAATVGPGRWGDYDPSVRRARRAGDAR